MALLIISLILLTILVSMYLLSKNKEKQSDNIVDKPEIKKQLNINFNDNTNVNSN